MELFGIRIPKEVIENEILNHLSRNDLLRFRRVSHSSKEIIDNYLNLKLQVDQAPEIEINPKNGKSFAAFMAMRIKTTKLYLNNPDGYRFYQDGNETEKAAKRLFMDMHGKHIKHLRMTQVTMWPEGPELEFLNCLDNIQTFQADHFGWGETVNTPEQQNALVKRVMSDWHLFKDAFPPSFKNLESIRIEENKENEAINKLKVTERIFIHCPKLKTASLPFTWTPGLPPPGPIIGSLMSEFYFLGHYIEPRPNDVYKEQGRLKLYDFINCHNDVEGWNVRTRDLVPLYWFSSLCFMQLLGKAKKTGLKLENVSPFWFYGRDAEDGRYNGKELGIPVVSLRGLNPMMMTMDMPNLEKITIPKTSLCVGVADGVEKPEWPALKGLDVTVDDCVGHAFHFEEIQDLTDTTIHEYQNIRGLWNLLFKDVVRINLTELELKFEGNGKWMKNVDASVPRIDYILSSCPNLKRIRLENWPGKNKQLLKLWEGLPGLEELTLENCREVGNVTFVGEEKEKPVFFKLQNLKKLTLKGVDKMTKITDLLFSLVLAKMNLKELVLTSENPLEKVTKDGITALLEGPFAGTIEKFPFENWSMAGVSAEEFKEMGMKFRSFNMI